MDERYLIELSRKDRALVSYFPGTEMKDDPDNYWIDGVLAPAVLPVVKRKSAKIRETPITFWSCVRRTARRPAEIFLFMTPAFPGAVIESAVSKALQSLENGNVHAGRELIPDEAYPCLQIFQGKLIRFYTALEGQSGLFVPTIQWKDDKPEALFIKIPKNKELTMVDVPIEDAVWLFIESRIIDISNGEQCRKFQQALIPVALETK